MPSPTELITEEGRQLDTEEGRLPAGSEAGLDAARRIEDHADAWYPMELVGLHGDRITPYGEWSR